MEKLKKLVCELENTEGDKEIIEKLKEVMSKLLTEYVIQVNSLEIEPLLVEAYYYNCDKTHGFMDENCHKWPEQATNFGKLYFHKTGYGGVDLCLSCGNYFLSFLLKCCRVTNDDIICRQTTLYDALLKQGPEVHLVSKYHGSLNQIVYLPRKGLIKETYKSQPLAALLIDEIIHKPVAVSLARGKQWTLAKYAIENGKEDIKSASNFLKEKKLYDCKLEEMYFSDALDYISKQ